MTRKSENERLETLEKQKVAIQNRIAAIKNATSRKERKADTRRKIIAGALALEHFEQHPGSDFHKVLLRLLDEYTKPQDRYLFSFLPEREATAPTADANPEASEMNRAA